MATDLIRYDLRVQDALRGVIRKVLADAARDGLSGDHHFQISFRTDAPGVVLSAAMRRRFQQEMTIILQYQFRELLVNDNVMEVVLFFDHVPERLVVPFAAITGFFDPSVDFGLRFEVKTEPEVEPVAPPRLVPGSREMSAPPRGAGSEPGQIKPARAKAAAEPAKLDMGVKAASKARSAESGPKPDEAASANGGKVISIDAFRRKP